ncbi:hypothetical protein CU098_003608 [Rhizopus stolonifer]|uniref:Phosphatidate cytidylyltransferase n=1 Tax=Rhizopus stolonifer TaxID=4846 RepID=A0A367KHK7_RHIST|nr:hypothetical protein CU098_003608 [Rhizopus stolonifer]
MLIYHNMLKGGIFCLVICNDIAAYAWGKYVGKTMLLSLSPKKTMEGFIGALMTTILFAYIFSAWLIKFDGLIQDKHNTLYNCIQYHAVILALYASLVAPFGGFFASAIKRASGLKDFGSFIPGHGGLSDRLDCQLFMAMFVYLYYDTIQ